jgi:hypothetical protein
MSLWLIATAARAALRTVAPAFTILEREALALRATDTEHL